MPVARRHSQKFATVVDKHRLNFSWLIRLRWSSIMGQVATIAGVWAFLDVSLPLFALTIVVALEVLSNLCCVYWLEKKGAVNEISLAGVMALDIAFLTGLLFFSGGPDNPFSFLYLVQIALATVVLKAYWTWSLVGLSLSAFAVLFYASHPLAIGDYHQEGMWVALAVASGFIVHFLLRVTAALAERETELAETRERAERQQRLASLATMAAGAAHELATPLGTIALVASELSRGIEHGKELDVEDVYLIRTQVSRCRDILDQLSGRAGERVGEEFRVVQVHELMKLAMENIRPTPKTVLSLDKAAETQAVAIPLEAVAQALRNIVTNAQDASPEDVPVEVKVRIDDTMVSIEVSDRGCGMSAAVKKRAVEPFFTTKHPGKGMGLGLFLSQSILDNLGGTLRINSNSTVGTHVTITVPIRADRNDE